MLVLPRKGLRHTQRGREYMVCLTELPLRHMLPSRATIAMGPSRIVCKAAACVCLFILCSTSILGAEPIPVRYREGVARGFLTLRSADGETLAEGGVVQIPKDKVVESRLTFHFTNSSLYDERIVFSQDHVFTLQRYHLAQQGPAFRTALDVSFDRETKRYIGWYADGKGNRQELRGMLQMPPDLYNGMTEVILRNLPLGGRATVQMVVFTPSPQVVKLPLVPFAEEKMLVGEIPTSATHYHVVPKLSGLRGVIASLIGVKLPTLHYWITREEVPAFLGFEGPLFFHGPVWRIGVSYRTIPPRVPQGK